MKTLSFLIFLELCLIYMTHTHTHTHRADAIPLHPQKIRLVYVSFAQNLCQKKMMGAIDFLPNTVKVHAVMYTSLILVFVSLDAIVSRWCSHSSLDSGSQIFIRMMKSI